MRIKKELRYTRKLASMKLLLGLFFLFSSVLPNTTPFKQPLCNNDEQSALLQFKSSLSIKKSAPTHPSAYPKTESWKSNGNRSDCCLWDGVKCDKGSGHVIGLDLSSSYLYGFIHPNSTLFDLVHLQTLNLGDNDFMYSSIPPNLSHLSNLEYLNLSQSRFSGQVPVVISKLSKLISLDLSANVEPSSGAHLLELQELSLTTMVQNFTSLKTLALSQVSISSRVPKILSNLSSLTTLFLDDCGLYGDFPPAIFQMPNLQILNVRDNNDLVGYLPEFYNGSKLQEIKLRSTGFSGKVPTSIGNLGLLREIEFINCGFEGTIPYSLGKLTQLTRLELSINNFKGQIPLTLANLTQLSYLALSSNQLTGEIPSFIANFTKLIVFDLGTNQLQGSIPTWISGLKNLKFLILGWNYFVGTVELDIFLNLRGLEFLEVTDVHVILPPEDEKRDIYPQLVALLLQNCSLTRFPSFLSSQKKLLDLSLSTNNIQGPVFVPPPSVALYDLSYNNLSGEMPPLLCKATSLFSLHLEFNSLSGTIPPCLSNLTNSLSVLSLQANNLHGTIPETFTSRCKMKSLNLNNNQLHGRVPRSLANCSSLEVLDLGSNQIDDSFPIWLGGLPKLHALLLGSNNLHGTIPLEFGISFPSLHVIDLSNNRLTGSLSNELFHHRSAMEAENQTKTSYMVASITFTTSNLDWEEIEMYSYTITNKGREASDIRILNVFMSIDLSNNRLVGQIPDSIGNLVGLQALNLSHNNLNSSIPSSLANLTSLESLDLSHNMLSGQIPAQLTGLVFLEIFDVSYNNLTGAIPQGQQFDTFQNESFEGNKGLCGDPLSRKCGNSKIPVPPQSSKGNDKEDDESSTKVIEWIIISMGYLSGLVVGVIVGGILTDKKHEWFVENFNKKRWNNRQPARRKRFH